MEEVTDTDIMEHTDVKELTAVPMAMEAHTVVLLQTELISEYLAEEVWLG